MFKKHLNSSVERKVKKLLKNKRHVQYITGLKEVGHRNLQTSDICLSNSSEFAGVADVFILNGISKFLLPLWLLLSECWLFAGPPSAPLVAGLVQRSSVSISTSLCPLQPSSSRSSSVLAASSLLLRSSVWAAPCDICEVKIKIVSDKSGYRVMATIIQR